MAARACRVVTDRRREGGISEGAEEGGGNGRGFWDEKGRRGREGEGGYIGRVPAAMGQAGEHMGGEGGEREGGSTRWALGTFV